MNSVHRNLQFSLGSLLDHLLFHIQNPLNFKHLLQIQSQILTNGLYNNVSLITKFLNSCARFEKLQYAALFCQNLPKQELSLWNLTIRLSAESSLDHEFICLYNRMIHEDVRPDNSTFSIILRACSSSLSAMKAGEGVHCQILKLGFEIDLFLQTGLLDFYSKIGDLASAHQIFVKMPERDVVTFNVMISAFGKHGRLGDARQLFDEMPEKNSASWNSMISCYCKWDDIAVARDLFDRNPVKDVVSWNAIIAGYCKSGDLKSAHELFNRMGSSKNSVSWNTMISGYVQSRDFSGALSMFHIMQVENVTPSEVTMVSLLSACAHLGALDMGRWIHAYVKHNRFKIDVVLGNALIDMYFKCGSVETALRTFHLLPKKNVFCWNSIIVGLSMHGYGREAIEALSQMEKERFKPDGVSFVGILCGCSHSGLVSEGRKYFFEMHHIYGITPEIEHYGCMVDLLGRAGLLEEAMKLIETMPMNPNAIVWGSLLRSCRIHKDTNLHERVIHRLLDLDPYDGGNYVFLSNIYASMNRWDDVESCRRVMIERRVHKTPGCSYIEVNNVVHEFVVGDSSHPQFADIIAFLDEISVELRGLGHDPDTSLVLHDIEEEEKQTAIRYHTEKIAIAFGIMSTRQGTPIRVVKNLRVCSDCHEATKLIAKLFGREIIMRDRNRFHHFTDGSCSCNDYW